MRRKNFLNCTH